MNEDACTPWSPRLLLLQGAALVASLLVLAGPARGQGCTPTQTGAVEEVFGGLRVASSSDGSYGLDGGACSVVYDFLEVGFGAPSADGTVTLANGASLSLLNRLQVGQVGSGMVSFESGSQGTAGDCWVSYRDFDAGSVDSGEGVLTVTGVGTQLSCSDELLVGVDGPGTLEVSDLAQMTAARITTSAFEFGATGTIRVTSGASLTITGSAGQTHIIAVRGPAEVDVDGGTFAFTDPSFGTLTTCTAEFCSADIRVANGGLLSAQFFFAGNDTTITLEGGTVETVQNLLRLDGSSVLQGSGSVRGDLDLRSDLTPGVDGIGALRVESDDDFDGNLVSSLGGKIVAEIAGPAHFDSVVVDGDLDFAGTLVVPFVDGYVPTLGSRFEIVTIGGAIDWDPGSVVISGLSPELEAETTVSETAGAIVVTVPEPGGEPLGLAAAAALWALSRPAARRRPRDRARIASLPGAFGAVPARPEAPNARVRPA